jgi:hypothetical protein
MKMPRDDGMPSRGRRSVTQKGERLACRAFDQLSRFDPAERTTPEDSSLLFEDLAVDFLEVALTILVHLPITSPNHASTVDIFLPQRSVTENPQTTAGLPLLQLPRHSAIIRSAFRTGVSAQKGFFSEPISSEELVGVTYKGAD